MWVNDEKPETWICFIIPSKNDDRFFIPESKDEGELERLEWLQMNLELLVAVKSLIRI